MLSTEKGSDFEPLLLCERCPPPTGYFSLLPCRDPQVAWSLLGGCLCSRPALPFALVCGIWTLPSGWQVTETCRALQSKKHKVYKALWAARMDLPLVMLLSTGSRGKHYLFLCQGNCVHVCCQSCMCDSTHTGTHRYTSLPCADILAPPLSEKGWHLNLEEGCPARKGTGVGLFQK